MSSSASSSSSTANAGQKVSKFRQYVPEEYDKWVVLGSAAAISFGLYWYFGKPAKPVYIRPYTLPTRLEERVRRLFRDADSDEDGYVTVEQIKEQMKYNYSLQDQLGPAWSMTIETLTNDPEEKIPFEEFRNYMYSHAVYISPAKEHALKSIEARFLQIDKDGDGVVRKEHLFAALQEDKELEKELGYSWSEVFDAIDSNHDQQITWTEFRFYLFHRAASARTIYTPSQKGYIMQKLKHAFQSLDTQNHGTVSISNFLNAVRHNVYFEDLLGKNWNEVCQQMDVNRDGMISWQEFRDFVFAKTPIFVPLPKREALHMTETVFQRMDAKNTGYVTKSAFLEAVNKDKTIMNAIEHDWNELMNSQDEDADAQVTWNEMKHYLFHKSPAYSVQFHDVLLNDIHDLFETCKLQPGDFADVKLLADVLSKSKELEDLIGYPWIDWFPQKLLDDGEISWEEVRALIFEYAPIYVPISKRDFLKIIKMTFLKCRHNEEGYISKKELLDKLSWSEYHRHESKDARVQAEAVEGFFGRRWSEVCDVYFQDDCLIKWEEFQHFLVRKLSQIETFQ